MCIRGKGNTDMEILVCFVPESLFLVLSSYRMSPWLVPELMDLYRMCKEKKKPSFLHRFKLPMHHTFSLFCVCSISQSE